MKNIRSHTFKLISRHHDRPFLADVRYEITKTPKPVVLFVHGFKGFKDWGAFNLIAGYFARAGFVFVKMNFSHNGTTPENPIKFVDLEAFGNNNFTIELDDSDVVIDHIFSEKCLVPGEEMDLNNFFMCGHSRGGAHVILKANEDHRIKAIATWAAINNLEGWQSKKELAYWKEAGVIYIPNSRTGQNMPLKYQLYEDYMANRKRLYVPDAIRNVHIPFLVVHGTGDETVPVATARQMKEWNPQIELFPVEGADHAFGATHPYDSPELPRDTKIIADKTIGFFRKVFENSRRM